MYGYQPSTHTRQLLPLTSATTDAHDMLAPITNIRDVVSHLLKLSKDEMVARLAKKCSYMSTWEPCLSLY
jgi:hypothetical protein